MNNRRNQRNYTYNLHCCLNDMDEETSLYYYGMSYYAAWLCRFINVDPLLFKYPYYTPFQYAGNMPITYTDLDGGEPKKNSEYKNNTDFNSQKSESTSSDPLGAIGHSKIQQYSINFQDLNGAVIVYYGNGRFEIDIARLSETSQESYQNAIARGENSVDPKTGKSDIGIRLTAFEINYKSVTLHPDYQLLGPEYTIIKTQGPIAQSTQYYDQRFGIELSSRATGNFAKVLVLL